MSGQIQAQTQDPLEIYKQHGEVEVHQVRNFKVYVFVCKYCGKEMASLYYNQFILMVRDHLRKHDVIL